MSHVKIIASLLLLFFNLSVNAKAVCTLLEKDVELRKYLFKCDGEIVNIQCEIKNKNVCTVNIKEKLESMKFSITSDELESFNLFSKAEFRGSECNVRQKICKIENDVCGKYQNFFETAKKDIQNNFKVASRCNGLLGDSVLGVAQLSTEIVSQPEFKKNSCETKYALDLQTLKNKISFFNEIVSKPILNRESFLYRCVQSVKVGDPKVQDGNVLRKAAQLNDFKNGILKKMQSSEYLASTVCESRAPLFFVEGKLNIDNVMCAVFEESRLELNDNDITCNGHGSKVSSGVSSRERSAELAGAKIANADATPIEQKPLPEAMASQIGKPIGLAPALAQVDQIAPGSGSSQGSGSESTIATGAVRNPIPTNIASQAGRAFAPVYEKLSVIGKSVGSSTSVRPGVIGSSSPARTGAAGVVTVTRKTPSSVSSDSSIADIAGSAPVVVANGLSQTAGKDSESSSKPSLARNSTRDEAAPALGGPRSLGLGSSGGSVGSRSPSNSDSEGNSTDSASSATAVIVQKKITQLNSPSQIASFFREEAVSIPNLRELLYSDETSKLLASKGIRVVNQSGDVAGESIAKAKYLYSDDGSKFTPLKLAKKN